MSCMLIAGVVSLIQVLPGRDHQFSAVGPAPLRLRHNGHLWPKLVPTRKLWRIKFKITSAVANIGPMSCFFTFVCKMSVMK
jgi:hypothetical protein